MLSFSPLILTPLSGIPLVKPGDELTKIILTALQTSGIKLQNNDIFVLAQKIVSKVEGRQVNLSTVEPSIKAVVHGSEADKDPRLVELIIQESNELLRIRPGLIIVEHRLGFICANAGIDHSNVGSPFPEGEESGEIGENNAEEWVLLLPENPDASAAELRQKLEAQTGAHLGVMIIDSHGRAWRNGTVGVTIGLSGVPGVVDKRGETDLFDYILRATEIGAADELAAAASLMMGQAAEGKPIIHVRGFPYPLRETRLDEILRSKENDLFR
jgi:coenzyme F420-0:L-glutamate ligase/coenzyme F420-1:gamma-L-glutamate ligase